MADFDYNTRYSEYGLIEHFEYSSDDRSVSSIPKLINQVTNFRFTSYESSIQAKYHVVKEGDDIHRLAMRYFGDAKLWWFIADYNYNIDFENLQRNQVIYIPPYLEISSFGE